MTSNQRSRPLTQWNLGAFTYSASGNSSNTLASPPEAKQKEAAKPPATPPPLAMPRPSRPKDPLPPPQIPTLSENPWSTYEEVLSFPKRQVCLARRRGNYAELVNVQQLRQDPSSVAHVVETVNRVIHPSFLHLVRCYRHANRSFLIWEPTEFSLTQVLGSACTISEVEIASIVHAILKGIQHLRDRGKALATLDNDQILFTEAGAVKIAGVERSCDIDPSVMNADTLKLRKLAETVLRLMKKNGAHHAWSPAAQGLPEKLRTEPLDRLLQDEFFTQSNDGGELKSLVSVVNKTALHNFSFPAQKENPL
ncbi:uncharacterized protein N7443_008186 [Penicillium atrosanguineum]|uniref:uncharacterized protein n=1 Tax=Penicillium atrosanguineum TaxID=1132637 RepID=UPI0023A73DF4|nr:uncharacterized protein N7443_008186 [Penicillium atrosanguineum]KAJ5297293.1 hypothetical protein N7443_008186 [Penicillium atrosanguineum]